MQSFSDIIDALGGSGVLSKALGLPLGTTSAMKTRDSIPPEYWRDVVSLAKSRGVDGVTYERMAVFAAARKKRVALSQGAA